MFLEHLNIILFELAQKYHGMLSKADITSSDDMLSGKSLQIQDHQGFSYSPAASFSSGTSTVTSIGKEMAGYIDTDLYRLLDQKENLKGPSCSHGMLRL